MKNSLLLTFQRLLQTQSIDNTEATRFLMNEVVENDRRMEALKDSLISVTYDIERLQEDHSDQQKEIDRLREKLDKLDDAVETLLDYQKTYPTVMWYWVHQRKSVIFTIMLVFFAYTFLFWPITFMNIREALLDFFGLADFSGQPIP